MPEREIQTPIGKIEVQKPRVNDKRVDEEGERIRFTSNILPPYLRRTRSLEELIPWLYLLLRVAVDLMSRDQFAGCLLGLNSAQRSVAGIRTSTRSESSTPSSTSRLRSDRPAKETLYVPERSPVCR